MNIFATLIVATTLFINKPINSIPDYIYDFSYIGKPEIIDMFDDSEFKCMEEALYYEARGESNEGLLMVANVILNRKESSKYPNTICGVVNQRGQFSYVKNKYGMNEKNSHKRIKWIAVKAINGYNKNMDDGIMYYHTISTTPYWANTMVKKYTIGNHVFY